jgi:hypothetical protein
MLSYTKSRFYEIRIRLENHVPTSRLNGFLWELFLFGFKQDRIRICADWSGMHCKSNDWIDHSVFGLGRVKPRSRIDLQGFIWTSIKIVEGKHGRTE